MSAFGGWIAGSSCRAMGENQGTVCLHGLMQNCHISSDCLLVSCLALPPAFWGGVPGCATSVLEGMGVSGGRGTCHWAMAESVPLEWCPRLRQPSLPKEQPPAMCFCVQLQYARTVLRSLDSLQGISFIWVEWAVNKLCRMLSFTVDNCFSSWNYKSVNAIFIFIF